MGLEEERGDERPRNLLGSENGRETEGEEGVDGFMRQFRSQYLS